MTKYSKKSSLAKLLLCLDFEFAISGFIMSNQFWHFRLPVLRQGEYLDRALCTIILCHSLLFI